MRWLIWEVISFSILSRVERNFVQLVSALRSVGFSLASSAREFERRLSALREMV